MLLPYGAEKSQKASMSTWAWDESIVLLVAVENTVYRMMDYPCNHADV